MYRLEEKRYLIEYYLNPGKDRKVIVDIDPMERGKGIQNNIDKMKIVEKAEDVLKESGDLIKTHKVYVRVDISAEKDENINITYAIAEPGRIEWEKQTIKIPEYIMNDLYSKCDLVSSRDIRGVWYEDII